MEGFGLIIYLFVYVCILDGIRRLIERHNKMKLQRATQKHRRHCSFFEMP